MILSKVFFCRFLKSEFAKFSCKINYIIVGSKFPKAISFFKKEENQRTLVNEIWSIKKLINLGEKN